VIGLIIPFKYYSQRTVIKLTAGSILFFRVEKYKSLTLLVVENYILSVSAESSQHSAGALQMMSAVVL
jgi:hypothetical protein